jgi:dipeptidyl aminopeptidase/acylaminoacyl peptidase
MSFLSILSSFIIVTSYCAWSGSGDGGNGDGGDGVNQPDSTRLVWTGADSWYWPYKLYSAYWDATDRIDLAQPLEPLAGIDNSAVSPNGILVVFVVSDDQQGLYVIGVEGGSLIDISGPLPDIKSIQWAPDSFYIAYFADQEIDDIFELYISQPNGSSNVKISGPLPNHLTCIPQPYIIPLPGYCSGEFVQICEWAPDSSRIAYIATLNSDDSAELYTSLVDGSGTVKINDPLPEGQSVYSLKWAPDGSRLVYIAGDDLYTSLPDGADNVQVNNLLERNRRIFSVGRSSESSFIAYDICSLILYQYISPFDYESYGGSVKTDCDLRIALPGGIGNVIVNEEDVSAKNFRSSPYSSRIAYLATEPMTEVSSRGTYSIYTCLPDGNEKILVYLSNSVANGVGNFEWAP